MEHYHIIGIYSSLGGAGEMAKAERIAAYIGALNLRAIVVRTTSAGPFCKIGFSSEFHPSRLKPQTDVAAELWFAKPAHAELVTMTLRNDFRDIGAIRDQGWIDLPAADVVEKIDITSRLLGATFRSVDQIEAAATSAVEQIEGQVEQLRRSGGLKALNAKFKTYRADRTAAGLAAMTYGAYLGEFTTGMIRSVAANLAATAPANFGALQTGRTIASSIIGALRES